LELVDPWSPSPTMDEECSVYTPGRCPSGLEEFAIGAKLGLITPLPNPCKFLVTPILASERCGPSDSVCWPSVMFGELALADEGAHLNPPCCVWGGYLNCSSSGCCSGLGRLSWTVHSFAWAAVHCFVLRSSARLRCRWSSCVDNPSLCVQILHSRCRAGVRTAVSPPE
jgi:hypothetical protein